MKILNQFLIVFFGLSASIPLFGQQLPLNNQYHINPFSLSPALAGHNNNIEVFMNYRNSWAGVDGAPEVSNININSKLIDNMGVGGSITNDKIGVFRNFNASLAYSYQYKLAQDKALRFGLGLGVSETFIDVGNASQSNQQDPIIRSNTNTNNTLLDVSFGASYLYGNWNFGVVIPRLIESTVQDDENSNSIFTSSRHFQSYIRYSYIINKEFSLNPTAIVRTTANSPLSYELGALIRYQKMLWLSLSYRKEETIAISIGGLPHERIAFNYSYETGGEIASASAGSGGTHEISIGFLLGANKNTTTSIFNFNDNSKKKPYLKYMDNGRLKL